MNRYEYKVIPAPAKGRKGPGVKGPEARFAHGLETAINAAAAEGWEYLRADILPSEERQGLTSTHTVYRSVLVFRRMLAADEEYAPPPPETATTADAEEGEEIVESSEAYEDQAPSGTDEGEETSGPADQGRSYP